MTYKGNMYALSPHPIAVQTSKVHLLCELMTRQMYPGLPDCGMQCCLTAGTS